jgi:hypothetical protein
MRDFVSISAKIAALICAAFFIIVTAGVLFLFNAERILFNPQSVKSAFAEQGIYDRLPGLMAHQLASLDYGSAQGVSDAPAFLKNLNENDWQVIVSQVVTRSWLQAQTESVVDQYYAYLEAGQTPVKISLAEVKVRLQGQPGMNAFLQVLQSKPACNQQQLMRLGQAALLGQMDNLPLCNPPQELVSQFQPEIQTGLGVLAETIPNEMDLTQNIASSRSSSSSPSQGIQLARFLLRLSPILSLGLLVLILLFAVRSFRELLLWWGVPLLLAGLLAVALGLAAAPILTNFSMSQMTRNMENPAAAVDAIQIVRDIFFSISSQVGQAVVFQGLVIALLGLVMAVIALFIPRRTV